MVLALRHRAAQRISSLIQTVDHFIANRESEQVLAAFREVTRHIQVWIDQNGTIPDGEPRVEKALLAEMAGLRYAASLRASVNRRGDWYNFDYWHGLGYGSRCEAVTRTEKQLRDLEAVIGNLLADSGLSDTHGFLRHLNTQVDEAVKEFSEGIQAVGEAAFGEQLREDHEYWQRCRDRWGGGLGYKSDIGDWTNNWFSQEHRVERRQFIEAELQRRWQELLVRIRSQIESAAPDEGLSTAEQLDGCHRGKNSERSTGCPP